MPEVARLPAAATVYRARVVITRFTYHVSQARFAHRFHQQRYLFQGPGRGHGAVNVLARSQSLYGLRPIEFGLGDYGYRVDLLVDGQLIVELKSVDRVMGVHRAQLLTYMKLSEVKVGLLLNFNVEILKTGIERFVL